MSEKNLGKIIAVDFDGTLCENAWPEIGAPRQAVIDYVLEEQRKGARLILWTNRSGVSLSAAVKWSAEHGIVFDAINENLLDVIDAFGNDCRKVFANEYIDDRSIPMPESKGSGFPGAVCVIREYLGAAEILAQLAEECAELAQAALKYRRVLTGDNPTPVKAPEAIEHLIEEMADVETCISLLATPENDKKRLEIRKFKTARWMTRLQNAEQEMLS